jgi:RNA polymerase sigma-70 factor (ECF subfamily)
MSEVPAFLAGVERSAAVIDEVCQLVRARLFVAREDAQPKSLEYSGRGSLASWLRVVTLRVASNRRRGEKHQVEFDDDVSATELLPAVDPELAVIRTRYGAAFNEALRRAFGGLTARERLLFRMHFLDGLNIERMGVVFGVHRATVARWLASAREAVLERTMTLLGDQLQLDARELASLLLVVRSALDVSLQGLLSAAEEKK